jgi:hypothetical protein
VLRLGQGSGAIKDWVAPVASLSMGGLGNQIGEIGGVIRTMLGLTRHSRIRDQIRGTVELYEMTAKYEALSGASADLAQVISQQTNRLLETSTATGRQWNWSSFIVSWIVAALFGFFAYLLEPDWGTWWGTLLIVIVGVPGALMVVAGLGVLLQQKSETV